MEGPTLQAGIGAQHIGIPLSSNHAEVHMARRIQRIGRGAFAGLAAGLAASWAMNQFQSLWLKASQELERQPKAQGQGDSGSQTESEDATMKAADKLSRTFLHRPLSQDEKKKVGPIIHYAFGSTMGALYGIGTEFFPEIAARGLGQALGLRYLWLLMRLACPHLAYREILQKPRFRLISMRLPHSLFMERQQRVYDASRLLRCNSRLLRELLGMVVVF